MPASLEINEWSFTTRLFYYIFILNLQKKNPWTCNADQSDRLTYWIIARDYLET